jgi:hypothetical protein
MNKQPSNKARLVIIVTLMVALAFIGNLVVWPVLSVQAGPTLPPRNVPTPNNDDDDDGGGSSPLLAFIELHAPTAAAGSWSVVQWQDSAGNWHDVEGWRGLLEGGYQRWTVEAKDFNTGLFRWQVRQGGPDGPVLNISEPFDLPAGAYEVVAVFAGGDSVSFDASE